MSDAAGAAARVPHQHLDRERARQRRARRGTSPRTGSTPSFYGTLSVIGVWGPLTPSEVAEQTGTPLTTVSDRLRRMVEDGDVERVAHPDDGRSHLVQLTEQGDAHWRAGLAGAAADDRAGQREPRPARSTSVEGALEDLIEALRKGRRSNLLRFRSIYSGFGVSCAPCADTSSSSHCSSSPAVAAAAGAAPRVVAKIRVGIAAVRRRRGVRLVLADELRHARRSAASTRARTRSRRPATSAPSRAGSPPAPAASGSTATARHASSASTARTLKVVKRIKVGVNVWDVAFAFGSVWATNNFDGSVVADRPGHEPHRQDDQDRRPADELRRRRRTRSGSANNAASGRPTRTSTGSIRRRTRSTAVRRRAHPARAGSSSAPTPVWVANGDNTVRAARPGTKAVVATVKVGQTAAAGRPRARRHDLDPELSSENTISVIDPQTNAVVAHDQADDGHGAVRPTPRLRRHVGRQLQGDKTSGASAPEARPPTTTRGRALRGPSSRVGN